VAIRLVLKISLLIALIALVEGVILFHPSSRDVVNNTYLDAWRAKHRRLTGPGQNRILLAGGSNVAFGVDSSKLETVTQRKTINLGLHGGLGLVHMLGEVEEGARAGDLVVLIPEYEHFYGDLMYGEQTAAELVQYEWSALRYFTSWQQWRAFLKNSQVLTSAAAFRLIDAVKMAVLGHPVQGRRVPTVYRSSAFDGHGDMVGHLEQPYMPDRVAAASERIAGEFNQDAVDAIARCAEELTARGVEFVAVYPAVAEVYWSVNQDRAVQVAAHLSTQWMLTKPEDGVFPDRLFYDTPYHLNRDGREKRTEQLLQVLQAWGMTAGGNRRFDR
jgi:hypothetical protein